MTKGTEEQSTTVISSLRKEDVQLIGQDIRFIKTGNPGLKARGNTFYGSVAFYLVYLVSAVLFVVLYFVYRKKARENANIALVRNKKANQESRKIYWFLTFFQQIKYFLVQIRGWEGISYLIINAFTGDIHSLPGVPIISKDLKRFAVASIDLEAGYVPNRIAIYQFFDNLT